ncbi:DUF2683 family protein [Mangrovibacterium marinum]|uniref:Uncharacterized protein n=1 Tax=Mangrovibacterium marinum TaxID=1639118 RepID=A0A2T5BZS9_9BACT|nr:DUF2683 family protein [Mangrovibacterium marinum]PTN07797.1 hypothetical protein C8N47_11363 [Mangrovibacterium marinum]
MTTVIINDKSAKGKRLIEFLKTLDYVTFETAQDSPYCKEFVRKIRKSEKQTGEKVDLDNLWK